jgi:hypothetical protein
MPVPGVGYRALLRELFPHAHALAIVQSNARLLEMSAIAEMFTEDHHFVKPNQPLQAFLGCERELSSGVSLTASLSG